MKKHFILTSLVAIVATGAAHAATDVAFSGAYTATTGTQNVSSGKPVSYDFDYIGTDKDGNPTDVVHSNTTDGYALTNFAYTLANGGDATWDPEAAAVSSAGYSTATKANDAGYENVIVADGYGVSADTEHAPIVASSYSYVNPQGGDNEVLVLNDSGNPVVKDLTKEFAYSTASSEFTGVGSKTTIDKNSTTLDGTAYVLLKDSADITYTLSEDGTGILMNGVTYAGTPAGELVTKFEDAKAAYVADASLFADAVTALANEQSALVENATKAKEAYSSDRDTQVVLANRYGTYTAAKEAYGKAHEDLDDLKENLGKDQGSYIAAKALYNAPIATTIDDAIDASVENGSVKTALDGKADADTVYTKAAADAKFLTEHQDISGKANTSDVDAALALKADTSDVELALDGKADKATTLAGYNIEDAYTKTEVEGLIAAGNELTLSNANDYTDTIATGLRGEFAAADALTLRNANSYTDAKVNSLEKNMSGGVAAATALSAVSVGNVERGEVSVGGGYGYFNGQSAMAFGGAMGLSDRWSVNAGAGIAQGDKTQFSIRAGTNYKFKLF